MPLFAEHLEVRVTARESCKTPFVAPDLSPVRLIDSELDKGLKGWTDFDVQIDDNVMVDGGKVSAAEQEFEAVNVGDEIVRKAPSRNPAKVRHPRPAKRRWS